MVQLSHTAANPIVQIETMGILAALHAWKHLLVNKAVIVFVDNDATRACLVTGTARERINSELVQAVCALEIELRSLVWYERVPSASNLADAPSRGSPPAPLPGWPAAVQAAGWSSSLAGWGVRES